MLVRVRHELAIQPQPVSYKCIGTSTVKCLQHSNAQVPLTEQEMRAQRLCRQWQEERQYRITASKFGTVIKCRRNHTNLAQQLLYPKVTGPIFALIWGQQHESDALEAYRTTLHSSFTVNQVEICNSDCGYLGASPDGVVEDSSNNPIHLIEVQCPYKA